jgi:hypothetical protein
LFDLVRSAAADSLIARPRDRLAFLSFILHSFLAPVKKILRILLQKFFICDHVSTFCTFFTPKIRQIAQNTQTRAEMRKTV